MLLCLAYLRWVNLISYIPFGSRIVAIALSLAKRTFQFRSNFLLMPALAFNLLQFILTSFDAS